VANLLILALLYLHTVHKPLATGGALDGNR
jgi:hypothetical protein